MIRSRLARYALALSAFAAALPAAQAQMKLQTSPWYMGVRAGLSESSDSGAAMTARLNARGHNVTVQRDDSSIGGSLYLGYRIHPQAAVEAGYTHLGRYETRASGGSANAAQFQQDFIQELAPDGDALSVALRMDYPVMGPVFFTPRFGGFYWMGREGGSEQRGGGGMLGLGFRIQAPAGLSVTTGYELLIPSGSAINQFLIGLEWAP